MLTFIGRRRSLFKQCFTPSSPDRDSNLNLPVIDSLVYCESSVLDHTATEAACDRLNNGGECVLYERDV
uniref:Uncharacterized protein n=1 Tax=Timema bartmani TaxID=61472 RepID=A0A7R9EUN5_9NEOP|nr:unnamed protein product [Timema bartmani]